MAEHDDDEYAELFRKLPSGSSSGSTSWQDVVAEFAALGSTFGDVLRGALKGTDADAGLGQLRETVQSLIEDANRAADGSPETQQARDQLLRLAESIRDVAQRAGEEVRPELLTLLRQANAELRRISHVDD